MSSMRRMTLHMKPSLVHWCIHGHIHSHRSFRQKKYRPWPNTNTNKKITHEPVQGCRQDDHACASNQTTMLRQERKKSHDSKDDHACASSLTTVHGQESLRQRQDPRRAALTKPSTLIKFP
eukprot:1037664-Pelagomonas_calceolata.AAC.5